MRRRTMTADHRPAPRRGLGARGPALALCLLGAPLLSMSCTQKGSAPPTQSVSEPAPVASKNKPRLEKLGLRGTGRGGGGTGEGTIGLGTLGTIGKGGGGGSGAGYGRGAGRLSGRYARRYRPGQSADKLLAKVAEGRATVPTRAWFPETFIFEPRVLTDAQGRAEVTVRVPDRLTTWRVLALAHDRAGGQAGAVTSFLGTLPVYVDPIVPKVLRSGDRVRLPVTVVNTTAAAVNTELRLSAVGVELVAGGAPEQLTLPAAGSLVRYVTIVAGRPGPARLLARLAQADAVVRSLQVVPLGRPVRATRSGTLASPRTLAIQRAAAADPTLGRVRLQVFPGALALLRSELTSAGDRGRDLADDAFALLLAGRAPALLKALGDAPAQQTSDKTRYEKALRARTARLRDMTLLATQRVLRAARVLDITSATLLAEAASAHPGDLVLSRLGERASKEIARKQLPDGTCGGETGWTLQRLLVATADCVRAAAKQRKVLVRASGAFERHARRIKDPYTAAAVLASAAVTPQQAERLRKLLLTFVRRLEDGSKVIDVPAGVVRADGVRPSAVEAAALAVLALKDVPGAPVSDLGAALLSSYSPGQGWGDGRANLVCMKAALVLFRNPLPAKVRIVLERDGAKIAERALTRAHLREVVQLEAAAPGAGAQSWKVIADPAVSGLGFSLTLTDRVPWPPAKPRGGVELSLTPPKVAFVGRTATVALRAIAPARLPMKIALRLPAGVQLDKKHLDGQVSSGVLTHYKADDAEVMLDVPGQPPAKVFALDVRVIPTLAGTLQSGASTLTVDGRPHFLPPATWNVSATKPTAK